MKLIKSSASSTVVENLKKNIGNSLRRSTESTEGTSFSQPFFFFLTVFFTTSFSQRQYLNVFLTTNVFFLFHNVFFTGSFSQRHSHNVFSQRLSHFSQRLSHVILTTFSLHSRPHKVVFTTSRYMR